MSLKFKTRRPINCVCLASSSRRAMHSGQYHIDLLTDQFPFRSSLNISPTLSLMRLSWQSTPLHRTFSQYSTSMTPFSMLLLFLVRIILCPRHDVVERLN